jgi:hypothetical protein
MDVRKFADLLCSDLVRRNTTFLSQNHLTTSLSHHHLNDVPAGAIHLKRIVHSGKTTREATYKQKVKYGRATGQSFSANCWMCRKYESEYKTTTWCCVDCETPLCNVDRTMPPRRMMSCLIEHETSPDPRIRCERGRKKGVFPADLKLY